MVKNQREGLLKNILKQYYMIIKGKKDWQEIFLCKVELTKEQESKIEFRKRIKSNKKTSKQDYWTINKVNKV